MPRSRTQRAGRVSDIWPGFVDVLATLLLVIIFLLVAFMLAQFFLQRVLSGRDEALALLSQQVEELASMLDLERRANVELRQSIAQLSTELQASTAERDELAGRLSAVLGERDELDVQLRGMLLEADTLRQDIEALKRVKADLEGEVSQMAAALEESEDAIAKLREEFTAERERATKLEARLSTEAERTALAQRELSEEQELSQEQREQIALLNQQVAALREQLKRIAEALDIAEAKAEEQEVVIADLGKRLNIALAGKVEELAKYRSEFFGRLREVLGDRPDIRIVGDRFVFQSDVLFETASAELSEDAKVQLADIAEALREIAKKIPREINWILQVDGHTDRRPISTPEYRSNWELSQARALSVVRFLTARGIAPERLSATGFSQYQPIDSGNDEIAYRRNRRIELRLTQH